MSDPVSIVWGCVVGLSIGLFALGLGILYLLNCRKTITVEHEKEYTGWKKWVIFFFKNLLFELVGLGLWFYTVYQLETGKWAPLDVTQMKICFYVFGILKYAIVIFMILHDELVSVKNFVITVANTGWVPPNWPEILEALIFIPCMILDGIFLNCDYVTGDDGDLFAYDGAILLFLDVILYLKSGILDTLDAYQHGYHYKILSIFYSLCEFFYTVLLSLVFVFLHLNALIGNPTTIALNQDMIMVLVVALLHPLVARFTSMCLQGIKATNSSKRLRDAPKARVAALNLYVRWFWFHPIMLIFNAAVYGVTFWLYISIFYVTGRLFSSTLSPEPVLQGALKGVLTLSTVFTVFYMVNLAYALVKRLGVFLARCCGCGCGFPFDCSTYAKAMNRGLAECNASFRMNTHMTCD